MLIGKGHKNLILVLHKIYSSPPLRKEPLFLHLLNFSFDQVQKEAFDGPVFGGGGHFEAVKGLTRESS